MAIILSALTIVFSLLTRRERRLMEEQHRDTLRILSEIEDCYPD